jgi:hypothetical protein
MTPEFCNGRWAERVDRLAVAFIGLNRGAVFALTLRCSTCDLVLAHFETVSRLIRVGFHHMANACGRLLGTAVQMLISAQLSRRDVTGVVL